MAQCGPTPDGGMLNHTPQYQPVAGPKRKSSVPTTSHTGRRPPASPGGSNALRRLTRSESVNVRSSERFAPNCPVSAFELVDADPGHRPHALAFDLDHRLGNLRNEVLLLSRGEDVLNHIYRDEWHLMVLQWFGRGRSGRPGKQDASGSAEKLCPALDSTLRCA